MLQSLVATLLGFEDIESDSWSRRGRSLSVGRVARDDFWDLCLEAIFVGKQVGEVGVSIIQHSTLMYAATAARQEDWRAPSTNGVAKAIISDHHRHQLSSSSSSSCDVSASPTSSSSSSSVLGQPGREKKEGGCGFDVPIIYFQPHSNQSEYPFVSIKSSRPYANQYSRHMSIRPLCRGRLIVSRLK